MAEQKQGLWLLENDSEFGVPSLEELTAAWLDHRPADLMVLPDDVYGVAERPSVMPRAVVSVDLCEVVRETGRALIELGGGGYDDMIADGKTGFLDYGANHLGWPKDRAQQYLERIVPQLFHYTEIPPVPFSDAVGAFMRKWRRENIYVIANTSTTVGAELGTLHYLHDIYPDSFQGVLFPRNHDGKGKMTKAISINATIETLMREHNSGTAPSVVAIDDAMHHAYDLDSTGADVFVPAYAWNEGLSRHDRITRVARTLGTVDSFMAADRRLSELLADDNISS